VRASPLRRRVFRASGFAWLVAATALLAGGASAQGPAAKAPGAGSDAPAAQKPAEAPPGPIPLPEIAIRSEQDTNLLRTIESGFGELPAVGAIREALPGLVDAHLSLLAETTRMLEQGARPRVVEALDESWRSARTTVAARNQTLTKQAAALDSEIQKLGRLEQQWQRTAQAAREAKAPQATIERVEATLAEIAATVKDLERRRGSILELQARVVREITVTDDAIARIGEYRKEVIGQIFRPDTRPIWQAMSSGEAAGEALSNLASDLHVGQVLLVGYVKRNPTRFALQLALFLALVWLFRSARERSRRASEQEPDLAQAAVVFAVPYSAALLLALLAVFWLHPDAPFQVRQLSALAALVPMLRIVRPIADPALAPGLGILAAFFVIDRLRDLFATSPLVEQVLFLAEMLAGIALMAWVLRPRRLEGVALTDDQRAALRPLGIGARVVLAAFASAVVSGAAGYMQLAHLLGGGALFGSYAALLFYASTRAAGGLFTFALRSRPLRLLRLVNTHREILRQRALSVLGWAATFGWVAVTLNAIGLGGWALAALRAVMGASLSFGSLTLSLGNVVAFAATVTAAFLLSRLLRFVLEEDVYPRVGLARGVPYAISSLLHYVLVFAGFVLAIFALGVDLTRVTILAGAFGVGIGFGLQNVVNNFVSGLIMLFERPMKLGDTVQVADVSGTVERIGIRSSTLRTFEGAEVVVPNASLISERLTNWTLSNMRRRIDVRLGVAYGTDPQKMLDLLLAVARGHRDVLAYPAPAALFLGFGESSLDFELRVWADDFDHWVRIRSELCLELHRALAQAGVDVPYPTRSLNVKLER
jgi:small-conductance mechanosensitive channel